jgi:aerobic carbon-monoxide dehydrogenase large subunit
MGQFGRRQLRAEDDNLIAGRGRYIDDVRLPGMLHVTIVRSQVARARIKVDVTSALSAKGVHAVFTADDLPSSARILPDCHPNPTLTYPRGPQVLALDQVRYVGEPLVAIVADDRYLAEDAAELVNVEYESLPAVIDLAAALEGDSARVHDDLKSNLAARIPVSTGDTEKAFSQAHCVVRRHLEIQRGAGQALETRGVIAYWSELDERMVVWNVSQVPFVHRTAIANALCVPENAVQVRNGDVGGGFGYKGLTYTEDILLPVIARAVGCPVKWIEDRREHLIASYHERAQIHDLEMALDEKGVILGIRGRFLYDAGAYTPWGPVVPLLTAVNIPGPYKVPNYKVDCDIIYTNTVPTAPVRGAGRPQACYVCERLLDEAARELKMDAAELRRRNLIRADEYPYELGFVSRDGTKRKYDSGNVPALLNRALEILGYDARREEQRKAHASGRYLGIGVACCVEDTGLGPFEEVELSIELDGTATVRMGTPSQGQGQRTAFAQIVAEELGIAFEKVKVLTGNTDLIRYSIGTFASRAGIVTGSAVLLAAQQLKTRAIAIGGILLQVPAEQLTLNDGAVRLKSDSSRAVSLQEIVHTSLGESGAPLPLRDLGPGMSTIASFCPPTNTFATGCHAALVEVDAKTCKVKILRYIAVEDFGNVINQMIVDGQVIGGIGLGIGNTFFEKVVYDEGGQILTGTFMDYLVATSMDVPRVELDYIATPSPLNPLGMKGAGQGGTIPVPAVITSAVEDALRPRHVRLDHVPFSESDLFTALNKPVANNAELRE